MSKPKKAALIAFLLLNLYAILAGSLYFFQENLIFHPTQLPQAYAFEFSTTYNEVYLDTPDGASLHALHFTSKKPKATIVYYHGNAGDLSRWGEIVQYFVAQQIDVVVMDYRGFGKSTGARSEQLLYDDSLLWYAFAKAHAEKTNTPLIAYGRSLGTTFATYVASKNKVEKLILETPFYSITDEAKSRFPFLPVNRLLHYKFATHSYINQVNAPIHILHGTDDGVVSYDHGKKLYEHIARSDKSFTTINGGGHNNLVTFEAYTKAVTSILE